VAGQAVDGGQVVGVKAMLHAQHESQEQQRQPVGGRGLHGVV